MCFRCPMFSLSGPCELTFFFPLDQSCGECNVILVYICVALFVLCIACLTVVVKQFAIFVGVAVILLLNV